MNRQAFFKILKNKQFLHLWLAHIASQVSAYLLNFTLMAKIYEITHSTTALSIFLIFYTKKAGFPAKHFIACSLFDFDFDFLPALLLIFGPGAG